MVGHEEKFNDGLFNKKLTQDQKTKQVMKCSKIFLTLARKKLMTIGDFRIF
jgi:hypothetical protein